MPGNLRGDTEMIQFVSVEITGTKKPTGTDLRDKIIPLQGWNLVNETAPLDSHTLGILAHLVRGWLGCPITSETRGIYRFHYHSEKVIGSLGIEHGRRLIAPLLVPRYPFFFLIEVSEKRASYPVPQRHWSQTNYMQMYQHEISQHGKARLTLLLRDMGTPKRWLNWSAHPIKPAGS